MSFPLDPQRRRGTLASVIQGRRFWIVRLLVGVVMFGVLLLGVRPELENRWLRLTVTCVAFVVLGLAIRPLPKRQGTRVAP